MQFPKKIFFYKKKIKRKFTKSFGAPTISKQKIFDELLKKMHQKKNKFNIY
jgi:hypothetical protein